ncbi:hypothetical protein [Bacillus sp. REN16]|uniref:hypothetical protein n=1 Tax=Bacillus sp. REN16 TaxID=2887296 RepID=UPI001E388EE7|nr:hypothetical protein [Bacillus sp. REN16]MCC3359242.1 hypothetical protein [Bacillus sp. REN16]
MKKLALSLISLAILLIGGGFVYLKFSPPLVAFQSGYSTDKQVLLVEVGNKNAFGEIEIQDVLVNNNSKPSDMKLQLSNPNNGFIITNHFNGDEASEYTFKDINELKLEPKTDPQEQLDKVNSGTATEDDPIYAVTLVHSESINRVIIHYNYLGLSFEKEVSIQ